MALLNGANNHSEDRIVSWSTPDDSSKIIKLSQNNNSNKTH